MSIDNEFKHNKAYLMRYRKMHTKIDRLKDKLNRLNERYDLKGVSYSSEPSSSVKKTLDDVLAQKEYLENKIDEMVSESIDIRNEIAEKLLDLDNQLEATVLDFYFLERYSLNDIADELSYSDRQIERLYVDGIMSVECR
ncbi:sigma-70 family RNA polymerase sigma factor [Ligilactobacillus salivarius]|uniref:sigma-70 family RNA polymerase sigma factor n=1 Tax=Ligilactobacillus salivarius TaxID=1624 RepID=UPI0013696784|nr:sigma-70 family RNA polymerase sigma factor [Ligilactobacillus salivarius]MYV19940.1 sigma-70 family RNA polymerase sigma factor [Ligilactobacillus salivarius]